MGAINNLITSFLVRYWFYLDPYIKGAFFNEGLLANMKKHIQKLDEFDMSILSEYLRGKYFKDSLIFSREGRFLLDVIQTKVALEVSILNAFDIFVKNILIDN